MTSQFNKLAGGMSAILAVVSLILLLMRVERQIDGDEFFVWSMIIYGWIAVNFSLISFIKQKQKVYFVVIANLSTFIIIAVAVLSLAGFEVRERHILWHQEDERAKKELLDIMSSHSSSEKIPEWIFSIKQHKGGTKLVFNRTMENRLEYEKLFFDMLVRHKSAKTPAIQTIVKAGDHPKMYEYTGLKVGDTLAAKIDWDKATLGWHKCDLSVPIMINDERAFVDTMNDKRLKENRYRYIGKTRAWYIVHSEEFEKRYMTILNELKFLNKPPKSMLTEAHYNGMNALVFDFPDDEEFSAFTKHCLNKKKHKIKFLLSIDEPYVTRGVYPFLSQHLEKWERVEETVFVGTDQMFGRFPYRLREFLR